MANSARSLYSAQFMAAMYPAFSRRATQVCILSSALEKIACGAPDAQKLALEALDQADAFGWLQRKATELNGSTS